jgi:hypothetical protein
MNKFPTFHPLFHSPRIQEAPEITYKRRLSALNTAYYPHPPFLEGVLGSINYAEKKNEPQRHTISKPFKTVTGKRHE